eukprot:jgi/Ulvmu1/7486/UM037_0030.1
MQWLAQERGPRVNTTRDLAGTSLPGHKHGAHGSGKDRVMYIAEAKPVRPLMPRSAAPSDCRRDHEGTTTRCTHACTTPGRLIYRSYVSLPSLNSTWLRMLPSSCLSSILSTAPGLLRQSLNYYDDSIQTATRVRSEQWCEGSVSRANCGPCEEHSSLLHMVKNAWTGGSCHT